MAHGLEDRKPSLHLECWWTLYSCKWVSSTLSPPISPLLSVTSNCFLLNTQLLFSFSPCSPSYSSRLVFTIFNLTRLTVSIHFFPDLVIFFFLFTNAIEFLAKFHWKFHNFICNWRNDILWPHISKNGYLLGVGMAMKCPVSKGHVKQYRSYSAETVCRVLTSKLSTCHFLSGE